jgi:hypothetical protein
MGTNINCSITLREFQISQWTTYYGTFTDSENSSDDNDDKDDDDDDNEGKEKALEMDENGKEEKTELVYRRRGCLKAKLFQSKNSEWQMSKN